MEKNDPTLRTWNNKDRKETANVVCSLATREKRNGKQDSSVSQEYVECPSIICLFRPSYSCIVLRLHSWTSPSPSIGRVRLDPCVRNAILRCRGSQSWSKAVIGSFRQYGMITKVTMARAYDMYPIQLSRRGNLSAPVAGGNRRSQMNRYRSRRSWSIASLSSFLRICKILMMKIGVTSCCVTKGLWFSVCRMCM